MIRAAVDVVERNGATHGYTVLDRGHLSRMTFNDRSLEQEVLQLFERQAELLMARRAACDCNACAYPERIRGRYRC